MTKKKDQSIPEQHEEETEILDSELTEIANELEKTKDMLLRTAAEFDNFKKRSEREKENLSSFVAAQTMKALLVPFDNLERAVSADSTKEDFLKGVELTVKQLKDAFLKLGLVQFGEVGDTFDPELFDAVMHKEDDALGESVVSQVLQKGYKFNDIVIRHAMVEVAN